MANTPLTRCSLQPTPSRAHCRYQCCKLVHNGPNVERFIVGRQFLLLFIVFIVSRIGGAGVMPQENFYIGNWEWSAEATQVFWNNSVLLMAVIIVPGHLVSQLMAAGKMLDFLELPYVLPFFFATMVPRPCHRCSAMLLLPHPPCLSATARTLAASTTLTLPSPCAPAA
jgi:hypothetical protein